MCPCSVAHLSAIHRNEESLSLNETCHPVAHRDAPKEIKVASAVELQERVRQARPRSTEETHFADGNENHLGTALVLFLQWRAREVTCDVRDDNWNVTEQLAGLLLLPPVEDVAGCEDAGVVQQLERRFHLDEAALRQDARAEGVDNLRVGTRAKGRDLKLHQDASGDC